MLLKNWFPDEVYRFDEFDTKGESWAPKCVTFPYPFEHRAGELLHAVDVDV